MTHPRQKPEIIWEDYNSNYIPPKNETGDEEGFSDNYDEDYNTSMNQFANLGIQGLMFGDVIKTPFGHFLRNDKLAPFNFYELKLIHLYGFSVNNFKDKEIFYNIMDSIEGISIWKIIDPHCLIIGKSKVYELSDVRANLDSKLKKYISNTNTQQSTQQKEKTEVDIDAIINNILNSDDSKEDGFIAVVFPNGATYQTAPSHDLYEKDREDILKLKNTVKNIKIIENGEVHAN